MAVTFPNGAQLAVASTIAASKNMTAITNAVQAVATLEASHGIVGNDILVMASGWGNLDGRVVKAASVATNDVTLAGIDTTNTNRFPSGSGTGSVRKISAWTGLTQVSNLRTSGGDQQFNQYQFLDSDTQRQLPTVRSPMTLEFELGDDPSLPWYSVMRSISDSRASTPLRLTLPNGGIIYYNGIITMSDTPTTSVNEIMMLSVVVSLSAITTRY